MGYSRRKLNQANKLKPIKKRPYVIVWLGAALVLIGSIAMMYVTCGKSPVNENSKVSSNEHEGDVSEANPMFIGGVGDECYILDPGFRRRKHISASNIQNCYDDVRGCSVHRYSVVERHPHAGYGEYKSTVSYSCDIISNKIVRWTLTKVNVPKNKWGAKDMFQDMVREAALTVAQPAGSRLVGASSNVTYRGKDEQRAADCLKSAIWDSVKAGSGIVEVQWKTPKCYAAYRFMWLEAQGAGVIEKIYSDRFIKDRDFEL